MKNFILPALVILGSFRGLLSQIGVYDELTCTPVDSRLQVPFYMKKAMDKSIEKALEACQHSFKWDRWNCSTLDFFAKHASNTLFWDREVSYVKAISTAAALYTITKDCSKGAIPECANSPGMALNADDPTKAAELYEQHVSPVLLDDFCGYVMKHNYKAIKNLMENSLLEECTCDHFNSTNSCAKNNCMPILKPFAEIAQEVRKMYIDAILVTSYGKNTRILWYNIPLDSLLFANNSHNYCKPNEKLTWKGVRGRQCNKKSNSTVLRKADRNRCRYLCTECGYTVKQKRDIFKSHCNCKLTPGHQCKKCRTVQQIHYCD